VSTGDVVGQALLVLFASFKRMLSQAQFDSVGM